MPLLAKSEANMMHLLDQLYWRAFLYGQCSQAEMRCKQQEGFFFCSR